MRLVLGIISTVVIGLGLMIYLPNDPVDFMGIPMGGKKSDIEDFEKNYRESGHRYINGMGIRKYSFCKSHKLYRSSKSHTNYFSSCEDDRLLVFLESSNTIEKAVVTRIFDIQQLDAHYEDMLAKYGQPISDTTEVNAQGWEYRTLTFGKQNKLITKVVVYIGINTDPEAPDIVEITTQVYTKKYMTYEYKVEEYYKKTFPTFYQES